MQRIEHIQYTVAHPFIRAADLRMSDFTRPYLNHLAIASVRIRSSFNLEKPTRVTIMNLEVITEAIIPALPGEMSPVLGLPARKIYDSLVSEAAFEPLKSNGLTEITCDLAFFIGKPGRCATSTATTTFATRYKQWSCAGNNMCRCGQESSVGRHEI